MTDQGKSTAPVVLRIKLRYEDVETLVARFAPNVGKAGLFLPTKSIHPVGTELKFEIRLAVGDAPVIVGLGRVKTAREPDPANARAVFGIGVELMRVTKESRELILKMLERRRSVGLTDVGVPNADDVELARRAGAGGEDNTGIRQILPADLTPTPAPAPLPVPLPIVDRPSDALLTAPRRPSGSMGVQRVPVEAVVAPLAPEPSRRVRRTIGDLIASVASASASTTAPSGDMFGGDDEVDVQSVLSRARTLAAGTDLDAELEALKDSAAAPLAEITIEAASAELARQLGGVAVNRKNRWAPPPPSAPAPAVTEVDAPRDEEAKSPAAKSTAALVLAKLVGDAGGERAGADFASTSAFAADDEAAAHAAVRAEDADADAGALAEPAAVGATDDAADAGARLRNRGNDVAAGATDANVGTEGARLRGRRGDLAAHTADTAAAGPAGAEAHAAAAGADAAERGDADAGALAGADATARGARTAAGGAEADDRADLSAPGAAARSKHGGGDAGNAPDPGARAAEGDDRADLSAPSAAARSTRDGGDGARDAAAGTEADVPARTTLDGAEDSGPQRRSGSAADERAARFSHEAAARRERRVTGRSAIIPIPQAPPDVEEGRPTLEDPPDITTDPAAPPADADTYDHDSFARAQSEAPETLPETEEVGDDDVVEEIGDADVDEIHDDPPEATVAVIPDPRIYAASIPTEDPDDVILLPPTQSQHTVAVDPNRALLIDDDVDPSVFDDQTDQPELDLDAAQFSVQTSVSPTPTALATAKPAPVAFDRENYGYERETVDPDHDNQLSERLDRALADAEESADEDFSFDEGTRNAAADEQQGSADDAEIDDFEILDEANLGEEGDFVNRLELSNEHSAAPDDPLAGFRDSVVSFGDERAAYRAPSDPLAGFSDDPSDPEGQPQWDSGTGSYTYAQQLRTHREHPNVADRFDSEFDARSTGYSGARAFEDTALPTNPTGRPRGYTVPPEPTTADPDLENALEALDVDLDDLSGNRPAVERSGLPRDVVDGPTNRPATGSARRAPRAPRAKSEDDGIMIDFDDDDE